LCKSEDDAVDEVGDLHQGKRARGQEGKRARGLGFGITKWMKLATCIRARGREGKRARGRET
jgi:hypothetical protein